MHFYSFIYRSYTCHIKAIQTYKSLGAEIVSISKILAFDQSCYTKDFVSMQMANRKWAADIGSKLLTKVFKAVNNSVYVS